MVNILYLNFWIKSFFVPNADGTQWQWSCRHHSCAGAPFYWSSHFSCFLSSCELRLISLLKFLNKIILCTKCRYSGSEVAATTAVLAPPFINPHLTLEFSCFLSSCQLRLIYFTWISEQNYSLYQTQMVHSGTEVAATTAVLAPPFIDPHLALEFYTLCTASTPPQNVFTLFPHSLTLTTNSLSARTQCVFQISINPLNSLNLQGLKPKPILRAGLL